MIEVTLDGYKYYYSKAEDKGYWMGFGGYKGSLSRIGHCSVPTSMWQELKEAAVNNGYSNEDFITEKQSVDKGKPSKKRAKAKKNSISIF